MTPPLSHQLRAAFISGLGFAALTQLHPRSPIAFLLIAATIYADGIVGVMAVGNELIMGAVPPERAGAAAAMVETATEFGAALGIAVLGSIGIAAYRSNLAASAPAGTPAGGPQPPPCRRPTGSSRAMDGVPGG